MLLKRKLLQLLTQVKTILFELGKSSLLTRQWALMEVMLPSLTIICNRIVLSKEEGEFLTKLHFHFYRKLVLLWMLLRASFRRKLCL